MKRQLFFSLGLIFFLIVGLTGCAGTGTHSTTKSEKKNLHLTIKQGSAALLTTANQIKQAIEESNTHKVQQLGPKLEKEWSVYEDQVKSAYPDLYEKVESDLDPAVAGSKASTLDKKTLEPLIVHLMDTVKELEKKAGNA
jgi:iron uptake system EfeUOB component EfeO/EfeM